MLSLVTNSDSSGNQRFTLKAGNNNFCSDVTGVQKCTASSVSTLETFTASTYSSDQLVMRGGWRYHLCGYGAQGVECLAPNLSLAETFTVEYQLTSGTVYLQSVANGQYCGLDGDISHINW